MWYTKDYAGYSFVPSSPAINTVKDANIFTELEDIL